MSDRLLYETHCHTPLCKHAIGEPSEYAAVAEERGLRGLIVTCHNPMPDGYSAHLRMSVDEFDEYVDLIARTREEWQGRVDVRLGLECDFFPGYESWVEQQLQSAEFHYVLGSVHPQVDEFKVRFPINVPTELHRTYFSLLADAAETGMFDAISHPDLIKNETPEDWRPDEIMDDICRALDRIAATGVAMELNTSGALKRIREMNPFPAMLREMRARDIPVVIGADAHLPQRVGDRFLPALDLLSECGYSEVQVFLDRQPQRLEIPAVQASLAAASPGV